MAATACSSRPSRSRISGYVWRRPAALVPTCSCVRVKPRSAVSTGPNTVFTVGMTRSPYKVSTRLARASLRHLHSRGRKGEDALRRHSRGRGDMSVWPKRFPGAALASRLCDEERDAPCCPCLVLCVRRIRRDGKLPESRPLGLVFDLADPHCLHRGMVADLD